MTKQFVQITMHPAAVKGMGWTSKDTTLNISSILSAGKTTSFDVYAITLHPADLVVLEKEHYGGYKIEKITAKISQEQANELGII